MSEDCLRKIRNLLAQRKVVLFVGAGASVAAYGPTGNQLTQEIKDKFSGADRNENNFFDVCQDIIDAPGNNLQDLEDYIRERLRKCTPSRWHHILAKQNWKAIFTTNYDVVIEKSYESKDALRECVPISTYEYVNPFIELDKVHLYKLMGSIADRDTNGSMVLTRFQYHENLLKRAKTFELLFDLVENGTVVFVGYSGKDRILFDIMERVKQKKGLERLAWSYAITPSDITEEDVKKLAAKKISAIKMSFQEFMDYLDEAPTEPLPQTLPPSNAFTVIIKGKNISLDPRLTFESEKQFEILNEKSPEGQIGRDDFFQGVTRSWVPFEKDWDFRREIYDNSGYPESNIKYSMMERIRNELSQTAISHNQTIVLKGAPGAGKTIVAKRIAFQAYKEGNPVIWIDPTKQKLDFKFLNAFIEDLGKLYQKEGGEASAFKVLIVIDDSHSSNVNPLRLNSFLTSSGRSVLILATERDSDFDEIGNHPPNTNIYELNQNLTLLEKSRFMSYLANLGFVGANDTWDSFISLGIENSFFAALYTLVHPSRQPLNEIIRSQYESMPKALKKVFSYICAFHQFNLNINQELLVRAMGCSYDEFFSYLSLPQAIGVIFDDYTQQGQAYYMSHHSIIAGKTIEFYYPYPEQQTQLFKEVLADINLSNEKERQLIDTLFSKHLSSKSRSTDLTIDMKRELFRTVCEQKESRTLLHHWGILETDAGNFEEAERLFKKALEMQTSVEGLRGETNQNILTSLGRMYSRMAIKALQDKDFEIVDNLIAKAERSFVSARSQGFPTVHSFHHHAYMYLNRYEYEQDKQNAFEWLARAMSVIDKAEDAIDKMSLLPIEELKLKAYSYIRNEKQIVEQAEQIARTYNSGKGYYIYANFVLLKKDNESLLKASKIVDDALAKFPYDDALLSLKLTIAMKFSGTRPEAFYDSLRKWYDTSTEHTPKNLYFLAIAAFRQEYYEEAHKYFTELNDLSLGHPNRTRLQYALLDDKGDRKNFKGVVHSISSASSGHIICTDLINLKYPVSFRPADCRFGLARGMRVVFNIAFSMIGPRATNVRKA